MTDTIEAALAFRGKVFTAMQELREVCDTLETLLPEAKWPFPTYSQLMFYL